MYYSVIDNREALILRVVPEKQNPKGELSKLVLGSVNLTGKLNVKKGVAAFCSITDLLAHLPHEGVARTAPVPTAPAFSPSASLNPWQVTVLCPQPSRDCRTSSCNCKRSNTFNIINARMCLTKSLGKSGACIVSRRSVLKLFLQLHPNPTLVHQLLFSGLPTPNSIFLEDIPKLDNLQLSLV